MTRPCPNLSSVLHVPTCSLQVQVLFGPMVQLYPPGHPLDPERRDGLNGPEYARAITIGDDCWIGGGAIILGVLIVPHSPCITDCPGPVTGTCSSNAMHKI